MIYDNFLKLCNDIGKTPSAAALDMGLSKTTVNRWKNGGGVTDATALKIANYFGITVEELKTGIKKEPSVPKDEELDKNDDLWETYDGLSEATKNLPLNEANLIFKILSDGEQGMNFNELYAFASVLSKLSPDERLRLFQLADRIQQDKSEP